MKTDTRALNPVIERAPSRYADYLTLTKPELSFLSVLTTFAGYYVAVQGSINYPILAATIFGTALLHSF